MDKPETCMITKGEGMKKSNENANTSSTPETEIQVLKYADGFSGPPLLSDSDLFRAFQLRQQAKQLSIQAEKMEDEAYQILAPFYLTSGTSNLAHQNYGTIEMFVGGQSRIDINRFCELLVIDHAIPAEVVSKAKTMATHSSVNSKVTVKFKPKK